jgi:hypothetical protein
MMGRTHMTTGLTSGAWLATAGAVAGLPPALVILTVPVAAYSALLPDLDHGRSTATLSIPPLTVPVSWVLRRFVDHRGPTHRARYAPAFGAAVAGPSAFLPGMLGGWVALWWFLVVTLGCLTHVWGDARTLSGTPSSRQQSEGWAVFRWSVDRRGRLRIGRRQFRTGSAHEEWRLHVIYLPAAVGSIFVAALVMRLASRG